MAKSLTFIAKRMGAAHQKFKASAPLRNQCDEQCSNKSAEHRAPAPGKARSIASELLLMSTAKSLYALRVTIF